MTLTRGMEIHFKSSRYPALLLVRSLRKLLTALIFHHEMIEHG